ncbi:MAG: hypothetical protein KA369_19230 [Spirochaetes bacterium]|nr:hypothetical protein [Spirochaetota bacterium]
MRGTAPYIAAIIAALILGCGAGRGADIRTVRAIEFKGLRLLSKYEVVRGARLKAVKGGIAVDVDSLEKALEKNAFLASYSVHESGQRLVVTVEEKRPALVIAALKGGRVYFYELDVNRAVISRNAAHSGRVPFVYVAGEDMERGVPSARLMNILSILDRVREQNTSLYRELSEMYCNENSVRVVLRGRKTGFILKPDIMEFTRLNYIAGYCDHAERYPDEIDMTGGAVVVR